MLVGLVCDVLSFIADQHSGFVTETVTTDLTPRNIDRSTGGISGCPLFIVMLLVVVVYN